MPARTADEAVALALSLVGRTESPAGSNRLPLPDGRTLWAAVGLSGYDRAKAPWCGGFVQYVVGAEASGIPADKMAYTPAALAAYKGMGWAVLEPQPGDIVWFNFSGGRHPEHVGLVVSVNRDGSLITVEGNTSPGDAGSQANGGGVYRRIRPTRFVVGYGRPRYLIRKEIAPMFSPPLQIAAVLDCPTGGLWAVAPDGAIYAFGGAPYLGGANGKPYFVGRTAARLNLVDGKYQIVATSGETYGPGF